MTNPTGQFLNTWKPEASESLHCIMKLQSTSILGTAMLAVTLLVATSAPTQAADHWWNFHRHHHDHDREYYLSRPRSSFAVTFGTGYAGRGYYYGPPGVAYFYERPGVYYYRTREAIPREYGYRSEPGYRSGGVASAVQRALARRGYYFGPIDGDIGPGSRRAIARYQARHGLRQSGEITPSLLHSLGID